MVESGAADILARGPVAGLAVQDGQGTDADAALQPCVRKNGAIRMLGPDTKRKTPGHRLFMTGRDRLVVTEGGGCMLAIGFGMVAAGVFCVLGGTTSMWNWPAGLAIPGVQWPMGMFVIGLALLVIGSATATHRTTTVFDRDTRRWIRTGSIFFVVNLYKTGTFDGFEKLRITRETRSSHGKHGRGSTFTYYPVLLKCASDDGGSLEHRFGAPCEHDEATTLAGDLGEFLGVEVEDKA